MDLEETADPIAIGPIAQPSREYAVYVLIDPRDQQVRYVGISKNPRNRYGQHLTRSKRENNVAKHRWIEELIQCGYTPTLLVIEKGLAKCEALQREIYWIQVYLEQGANLVNMRDANLMPWECR